MRTGVEAILAWNEDNGPAKPGEEGVKVAKLIIEIGAEAGGDLCGKCSYLDPDASGVTCDLFGVEEMVWHDYSYYRCLPCLSAEKAMKALVRGPEPVVDAGGLLVRCSRAGQPGCIGSECAAFEPHNLRPFDLDWFRCLCVGEYVSPERYVSPEAAPVDVKG
jgi:hypothetical protein